MNKNRGVRPREKIKIEWSSNFAYGVGLLVTDGNLSSDGRHISFTSKDIEQIKNFFKVFKIKNIKIGKSYSESSGKKMYYYRLQFGDVLFYRFLLSIGLTPAKSKTLGPIFVPDVYFFDYLRGCFDGDGCFSSYFDPRWKSSFMFYTEFASASVEHVYWMQKKIFSYISIKGHISKAQSSSCYKLRFAKSDSREVLKAMYANKKKVYLKRKRLKIDRALDMIGESIENIDK